MAVWQKNSSYYCNLPIELDKRNENFEWHRLDVLYVIQYRVHRRYQSLILWWYFAHWTRGQKEEEEKKVQGGTRGSGRGKGEGEEQEDKISL